MYLYSSRKDIFIYQEYSYGHTAGLNYCSYLIFYFYTWSSKSIIIIQTHSCGTMCRWYFYLSQQNPYKSYEQEGGKLCTKALSIWFEWTNHIMKETGLELPGEKTCLMLFNNGENTKHLSAKTRERRRVISNWRRSFSYFECRLSICIFIQEFYIIS